MKINNKNYTLPEINFNTLCQLEDMGVELNALNTKAISTVRAFIALAMDGDMKKAGEEFDAHIKNGGDAREIISEIGKAVKESGFFQTFSESSPQRIAESESAQNKEATL